MNPLATRTSKDAIQITTPTNLTLCQARQLHDSLNNAINEEFKAIWVTIKSVRYGPYRSLRIGNYGGQEDVFITEDENGCPGWFLADSLVVEIK
jgi:hypothetical protein